MEQTNIGILAPDGMFTPCDSYGHLDTALEIVEKILDGASFISTLKAEEYLLKLGYIVIQAHGAYSNIGYYKDDNSEERLHLTKEQKCWLEEHYEGCSDETRKGIDDIFEWDK